MILALAIILASAGYPEGAPWMHEAASGESCHSCHWDNEAEADSARLTIDGLPDRFEPGTRYALSIHLEGRRAASGFQLVASSGVFEAASEFTEANGTAVRSIYYSGDWNVVWIAGPEAETARFWLMVNDANGDMSEFGDRILLREFESLP